MHTTLTTITGNSVASRLKQCSLKVKLAEQEACPVSAFSPISRRETPDESPKKRLTDADKALIRVIAQYFQDLGLNDTVQTLSKESRCKVENTYAVRLRAAIHEKNWDDALVIIDSCYDHLSDAVIEKIRDILIEEKFFDLIIKRKRPLALHMLKTDFDPKNPMRDNLMKLLYETDEEIFSRKNYEKYRPSPNGDSHNDTERICTRLQKNLPPSFMLPANRLQTLLDQAFETQLSRCETHIHLEDECELATEPAMLFEDHKCPKRAEKYFVETCLREMPCSTRFKGFEIELDCLVRGHAPDHKSQVWKVQFSPCGKYLASASFATVVYFWKVNSRTRQLDLYRKISARDTTHGISGMSWSSDSKLLAVCGVDDHPYGMYVYDMHGDCLYATIPHHEAHSYTCLDFFRKPLADGVYQLTVGDMRGSILFVEIKKDHYHQIAIYEGYRIRCVYSCKSGRGAYAADTHNRVRWYRNTGNEQRKTDHTVIREENTITNMAMHPSEQLLLLTTKNLGLRMWNVQARTLLRTFQGYHDGGVVINACFGGINNEYIVTGSFSTDEYDDEGNVISKPINQDYSGEETIRIWRLTDEYVLCGIAGHRSTVNSVCWNPKDPFMIASGSDDHSIRLWSCRFEDLPNGEECPRTLKRKKEMKNGTAKRHSKDEDVIDETPLRRVDDEDIDVTGNNSDESDESDSEDSRDDESSTEDPTDYDYDDHEEGEGLQRREYLPEYRRIPLHDLFPMPREGDDNEDEDDEEYDEDEEEEEYYDEEQREGEEREDAFDREDEDDEDDDDDDDDDDESSSPIYHSPN
ncbi:hypothetical protein PMAYCL1PPCAC_30676 [Pristionchus mayeri]|uniref:WD40 domain-containing protein n=1 Tax=Pristionchus mayeri TaxID=1317129 RepID=A0AAN5IF52_9BILA|nr:hypothetical protein PMAYCL1PPCAC_30676 [Pristionchus mayeri]